MSDKPDPTARIVIADTPTPQLEHLRSALEDMLGWGLSQQARKSVEIKIKAIALTLKERGVS